MSIFFSLAAIVYCYVGCNSGSPDGEALHVLECDAGTGAAKIVQSVKGVTGTTYFQVDREGKYLYSVVSESRDGKTRGAAVRFPIDGWKLGAMERIAGLPCEAPCHVALTPDGKRVAFAAYTSATCGTVGVDGEGLASFTFPDDETGPNRKRQKKAYAHQVFFTQPDALRPAKMGVVDLGCDRIWFFNPETMERYKSLSIKADAGDGPRHALFMPRSLDKCLYVVNELGSSVSLYAFDGATFSKIGKWSMLPAGYDRWEQDGKTLSTKAAAIKLTADGKILMASNRGYDSIAFYEVGPGGKLTLKNIAKLCGRFPRDFELMPGEKFMVVGHKLSNEIRVYRFDRAACALEPVGEPIPCWRPLCFKFLEVARN